MKNVYLIACLLFAVGCIKPKNPIDLPIDNNLPILWGSSFGTMTGETHANSYLRVKAAFKKHQIVRIYCSAEPVWPAYIPLETVAQISFKLNARDVLDGKKDEVLTNFFNSLSTSVKIFWTYFHEPEDDIRDGAFTAEEYRLAFDYIINLQKKLNKPNLVPTLCLMGYTLDPVSKRNWKDYLPSKVELISWDSYYKESMGDSVGLVFDDIREVMKQIKLPWAVAETAVNKMKKQGNINEPLDVSQRRHWLNLLAKDLSTKTPLPVYVQYFDSSPPQDATYSSWRISDDSTMVAAWESGQQY